MDEYLSIEELKKENQELKNLLAKILKAYDLVSDELEEYKIKIMTQQNATVSSTDDVKKLLEKYSRL